MESRSHQNVAWLKFERGEPTMKVTHVFIVLILLGGFLVQTSPGWSAFDNSKRREKVILAKSETLLAQAVTKRKPEGTVKKYRFKYRPPKGIGRPKGTYGGGTRSLGKSILQVFVALSPQTDPIEHAGPHMGLTSYEQPSLFWFISHPTSDYVKLTITDQESDDPLLEVQVPSPVTPGFQVVYLRDYDFRLLFEKEYTWSVSLVPDKQHRSRNVITFGGIIRKPLPKKLLMEISEADPLNATILYAEAGFWYDALAQISNGIIKNPDNEDLRLIRRSLLEQGGFKNIK